MGRSLLGTNRVLFLSLTDTNVEGIGQFENGGLVFQTSRSNRLLKQIQGPSEHGPMQLHRIHIYETNPVSSIWRET